MLKRRVLTGYGSDRLRQSWSQSPHELSTLLKGPRFLHVKRYLANTDGHGNDRGSGQSNFSWFLEIFIQHNRPLFTQSLTSNKLSMYLLSLLPIVSKYGIWKLPGHWFYNILVTIYYSWSEYQKPAGTVHLRLPEVLTSQCQYSSPVQVKGGFQHRAVVLAIIPIGLVHSPGHPSLGSHSAASPQALNVEKYSSPSH